MKFQFVKTLLLGSFFALGSIGLTACGGDSSSSADEGDSSSSAEPLVLSSVSETSPLDEGSKISVDVQADGKGGYILSLSGIIKTDSDEFETEGYEGDDRVHVAGRRVERVVGRVALIRFFQAEDGIRD